MTSVAGNRNVVAWLLLMSALTLHVFDEAVTGFLPFYNQQVHRIWDSIGFLPVPAFSFSVWLGGLMAVIVVGFALSPVVGRGGRFMRVLAIGLGLLMILNALGHMAGSVYFGRVLPGFWSSPVLLAAAVYLTVRGFGSAGWRGRGSRV